MSDRHHTYLHCAEWYRHVLRHCLPRRHSDDGYRQGARWAIGRLKRRPDSKTGK